MQNLTIQRLRQNAVNLIAKDQSVKTLADIVAELCLICEQQQHDLEQLRVEFKAQSQVQSPQE